MLLITYWFQVTTHHEELLHRAVEINNLSGSLTSVRRGLDDVDASLEKYVVMFCRYVATYATESDFARKFVFHTEPWKRAPLGFNAPVKPQMHCGVFHVSSCFHDVWILKWPSSLHSTSRAPLKRNSTIQTAYSQISKTTRSALLPKRRWQ